jgi:hypothetical protein
MNEDEFFEYRDDREGALKHPSPEELRPLLDAIDVAVWAWAVKSHTSAGQPCEVDWKQSLDDLGRAWIAYQNTMVTMIK